MAGKRWDLEFNPAGVDKALPKGHHPEPGTRVVLTPLAPGVRRSASYAHISHDDGTPIGLVLKKSLMRVSKTSGGNAQPEATDRALDQFRDRRSTI